MARRQADWTGVSAIAMEQGSPRSRVKAVAKGEPLATPLLMPVVFNLGARLENVPLREFLANPTKLSNALRQIRATLQVDGIWCYFDPLLEIEALGAKLDWTSEPAQWMNRSDGSGLLAALGSADQILRKSRVPVVVEVLKRARVMLKDEPALTVRVTGPLTLAAQLAGNAQFLDAELVDRCAEITSALVKAYLDVGADVIFVVENVLPIRTSEFRDFWAGLLDPIFNVTRFYEALPVLVLDDPQVSVAALRLITERNWECVLCPSAALAKMLPSNAWMSASPLIGYALEPAAVMKRFNRAGPLHLRRAWGDAKTILLTTAEDISSSVDLKQLAAGLQQLRGALVTAG